MFNKRLTDLISATGYQQRYSKVIHLFEDVWIAKNDIVKARLSVQSGQGKQRRIFARKTTAQRINATAAMSFLDEHHLWGATRAKYYFGLFLEQSNHGDPVGNDHRELVAVATFSARRRVKRNGWTFKSHELLRYCAQKNAFVVGGISKLCKAFINDVRPDDLVTVVDRDWGDGSGWHSIGFRTVATMDPLAMIVNPNESGVRRHLVGAGIKIDDTDPSSATELDFRRLGLPRKVWNQINETTDVRQILSDLAGGDFYPVYDTGVERLFWVVNSTIPVCGTASLWGQSQPKYTGTYYSDNIGIMSLLQDAATVSRPLDSPQSIEDSMSWKATSGCAGSASLIFSAPSSMDPDATVEVRERRGGWRTVGIVGSKRNPSIYHSIYKVDDKKTANGQKEVQPDVVVSEFIKTMAILALAGIPRHHHQPQQQHQQQQQQQQLGHYDNENNKEETDNRDNDHRLRFLHFGFGAGTLVRYLANRVKNSEHVAVELDRGVVEASTGLLPDGPNSVSILAQDALEFVAETESQKNAQPFDCICIDVFDENLKVPTEFYSPSFLRSLSGNLMTHDGILVQNFHSGGKRRAAILEDAAKASCEVFADSCFVPSLDSKPNAGNSILLASKQPFREVGDCGDDVVKYLSKKALLVQERYGLSFDAVARVQRAARNDSESR